MPDSQQPEAPNPAMPNPDIPNPAMDEAREEQQRDWRDEAGETFVNLMFAREGLMQSRVQRQQNFEERLKEHALTGQWPNGDGESMGGVSVGNKVFNFHGDSSASAAALHAGRDAVPANPEPEQPQAEQPPTATPPAEAEQASKGSKLKSTLGMLLPLAVGTALGLGVHALLDRTAGDAGRPRPAVNVRTALELPDGTVVPIRPELFDSTEFFPER